MGESHCYKMHMYYFDGTSPGCNVALIRPHLDKSISQMNKCHANVLFYACSSVWMLQTVMLWCADKIKNEETTEMTSSLFCAGEQ